jgi:hypothetical protein
LTTTTDGATAANASAKDVAHARPAASRTPGVSDRTARASFRGIERCGATSARLPPRAVAGRELLRYQYEHAANQEGASKRKIRVVQDP